MPGASETWASRFFRQGNVFSARWTSEDNLIDCGFLDGPLAELAAAPQDLICKLIGE